MKVGSRHFTIVLYATQLRWAPSIKVAEDEDGGWALTGGNGICS